MQVTSTTRRFHVHPVWIVTAISAVLLGVLLAGVAVSLTRDESPSVVAPISSVVEPKTNDSFRFAEMNELPDASPARMRAVDRQQFIEMNRMADVVPSTVQTYETMHFNEINELPGGESTFIPPFGDPRLGRN